MKSTTIIRVPNNFDVLRILFAWFVIISHSYVLNGQGATDPLANITDNYLVFSYIGVKGFFIISGYLIFQSLQRSKSIGEYLIKRILRIFPGLFVVLALTLLFVYFIYPHSTIPYLFDPEIYKYFLGNLSLFMPHFYIRGVFEHQFTNAINGSLWTIEFEFLFYVILLIVFPIRKNIKYTRFTLIALICLFTIGNMYFQTSLFTITKPVNLGLTFELGSFFMMGSFMACFEWDAIPNKPTLLIGAIILFLLTVVFKLNHTFLAFSLTIIILGIGKRKSTIASLTHKYLGDPSYGIYLYAFPLQQIIIYYVHPSTLTLFITSSIGAFILGYLSWNLVEKKALKYKQKFSV